MSEKKIKKEEFKVWLIIEKHTEFEDGTKEHNDEEHINSSIGVATYSNLLEAQAAIKRLSETYY